MASPKGVILAGGVGARLDRLNSPKPLVRVGAESMVLRALKQLEQAGVSDVTVVVGHRGNEIIKDILGRKEIKTNLTFIEQTADESAGGLLQSFLRVETEPDLPVLVTMADLVFAENPYTTVLKSAGPDKILYTLVGSHREHKFLCGANSRAVLVNGELKCVGRDLDEFDGVEAGIYFLPQGIGPLREHYNKTKPNLLSELINGLAEQKQIGVVRWSDDKWYDVNTPALHTKANMLIREIENEPFLMAINAPREALTNFAFFDRERNMVSEIYIQRGLVSNIGTFDIIPAKKSSSPHYILTDSRVNSFYGDRVLNSFMNAGYNFKKIVVPEGEGSKSLETYSEVADKLFSSGIDKNTILFSLGGGVVNNLAGVLASTLYRGIELIHISTSSMSQVDASLDFKQAINSRMGKNLIGSYYPASKILIDPEVLLTQTPRHLRDGIAESIKHALTQSADFVDFLKESAGHLDDVTVLEEIVRRTVSLKVPLLRGDAHNDFNEMLPQYGHSVAHAVEHLSAYELYHGEAVAVGICVSAEISAILGFCDDETVRAHYELCKLYKLPTVVPENISTEDILDKIRYDKHYLKGLPHMALPVSVGEMWHQGGVYSVPVEYDIIKEAIRRNKEKI